MKRRSFLWVAAVFLLHAASAVSQDKPARLTFDVASIKLSQSDEQGGGIKPLPGGNGYIALNMPVKIIIALMYKVPMRQITGGPDWLNSERYDIEARVDGSYSVDDLHIMFQNLLADRFNFQFHKDSREGNVYALTVDKSGLKMKADGTGQDMKIPINFGRNNEVIGTRVPMQYLCWWLGQQLQNDARPVVDKTGLDKSYDFTLTFAPQLPPGVSRDSLPPELQELPSIFDAVRDQLGLKLEPTRGPVDYYIIDHIDRPSPN
jgi:uncharacterized protein (TIGR03435 family)